MTVTVGAFEAKTHFSELLARAAAGETIEVTKHGHPVAKIVPLDDEAALRRQREEAFAEIMEHRKDRKLGPDFSVREAIEQGRRRAWMDEMFGEDYVS